MIWKPKRVLALAPHTDDVELGVGGTICRIIGEGTEVYSAAFSIAQQSVPEGFPRDILATEVRQASAELGILDDHLLVYDFEVRRFPQYRQEILETLVKLRRELDPDLVFVNASSDIHQDHRTLHEESKRAFAGKTILGYELPWNMDEFRSTMLVSLEKEHIEAKIRAVNCYKSQQHRFYAVEESVRGLATLRGLPARVPYAEAFEVIRWIYPITK